MAPFPAAVVRQHDAPRRVEHHDGRGIHFDGREHHLLFELADVIVQIDLGDPRKTRGLP